MKNIFILGVPRTGKSTLSKMLIKELNAYSIIKLDALRNAFDDTFPELEINNRRGKGMKEDFPRFISNLINRDNTLVKNEHATIYEEELGYIIEGDSILPSIFHEFFEQKNVIVVFLGNGDLSKEEIFQNIRKHDTIKDYSYYRSDERVMESCVRAVEKNKTIQKECKRYNYPYYNTSKDREEVLNQIKEDIKEMIKE